MPKPIRPYRGMRGDYVLLLAYDGVWVPHAGSNNEATLRTERRRLPQWPDSRVLIASNRVGDEPAAPPAAS